MKYLLIGALLMAHSLTHAGSLQTWDLTTDGTTVADNQFSPKTIFYVATISPGSTGYTTEFAGQEGQGKVERVEAEDKQGTMPGAAKLLAFKALENGVVTLKFTSFQPWDKEATQTTHDVNVLVAEAIPAEVIRQGLLTGKWNELQ